MILTSIKPVNARVGQPSTNAPDPRYLIAGSKIKVISRVLGDKVNGNSVWVVTEDNEYFTTEGFIIPNEINLIPFYSNNEYIPSLFRVLNISELWDFSKSMGEKISIGIIDNGVANHPCLRGKVKELNITCPQCQDLDSHGTNMACIIAALDENKGLLGVSPMVETIYSYRINIDKDKCNIESNELLAALDAMAKVNVHIINMSFTCIKPSFSIANESGRKVQEKINTLSEKGCLIICSTGNNVGRKPIVFPACYKNVISVTGYSEAGNILNKTSSYWNGVSISMPVQHYYKSKGLNKSNGTSAAAAILTGCLACTYNLIKHPKFSFLLKAFNNFSMITGDGQINVPKFETNKFIQLLKT